MIRGIRYDQGSNHWSVRLTRSPIFTFKLFLIGFPITVAGYSLSILGQISEQSSSRKFQWFLAVLLSSFLVGLWMFAVDKLFLSNLKTRLPLYGALALLGTNGLIFSVAILVSQNLLKTNIYTRPLIFLLTNCLLSAWIGVVINLVLESRSQIDELRNTTLNSAVNQELIAIEQADVSRLLREYLDNQLFDQFGDLKVKLDTALASAEANSRIGVWVNIPDELRVASRDSSQKIAMNLRKIAELQYPRLSIFTLPYAVIKERRLRPTAMFLLAFLVTLSENISQHGLILGFLLSILGSVGVYVLVKVGNILIDGELVTPMNTHFLVLVLLSAGGVFATYVTGTRMSLAQICLTVLVNAFFLSATSLFGAVRSANLEFLGQIASRNKNAFLAAIAQQRQMNLIARQVSQILHGQVQTRLIACAVALERSLSQNDQESFIATLRQARTIIEGPIAFSSPPRTLLTAIERISQRWSGLINIDNRDLFEIDDAYILQHLEMALDEAVSNAFRHGSAENVEISIIKDGDIATLFVSDDGQGLEKDHKSGAGSALLTSIYGKDWKLSAGGILGGAQLEIRFNTPKR